MIDITKWNNVSKSLLLPLYFRAFETEKNNPMIKDEKACEIVKKINYDFDEIKDFNIIQTATVMREKVFDGLVLDFLEKNPEAVVINIGSGLDTRFFRMDNGSVVWYELDLPEVMDARKELFKESKRHIFIGASAFDSKWIEKIDRTKGPVLLLAEGMLFYFSKESVKKFVLDLKENFYGANLLFDAVSPLQAMLSQFNPTLKMMDVWFKWGMSFGNEVKFWDSDIETNDVIYYFKPSFDRLGWYGWYSMVPAVRFGFYIISCILGKDDN